MTSPRRHPLLVIKAGVLDGKTLTPEEITKLADLESREVLLAKLAGAMKGSLTKAAYLFAAPLSQTARVVDALRRRSRRRVRLRAPAAEAPTRPLRPPRQPPTSPRVATRADSRSRVSSSIQPTRHSRQRTRKEATMAKLSTDELLDAFKEMTLIELSEFVKQFEETFEVTAAAPVAVAAAGAAAGGGAAAAAEEQDEFDVVLERRWREEDPGHQGGPRAHEPRPQGGQGPRRRRPQARPREGRQGCGREGQGGRSRAPAPPSPSSDLRPGSAGTDCTTAKAGPTTTVGPAFARPRRPAPRRCRSPAGSPLPVTSPSPRR